MIINLAAYFFIGFYTLTMLFVSLYSLFQFHLLLKYQQSKKKEEWNSPVASEWNRSLPLVTIQLPVYNEQFVVERLIDNILELRYPSDKLQIQVLDDSTDLTSEISQKKIEECQNKGYNIQLIRRKNRDAFKAGALRNGLLTATGEFIAIFDADFLPGPDFLFKTLPYFMDPQVGVVQTRWEHINEHYSLITRLQAFQLNVHFTIEQAGRQSGDYLLQFNGTAGVWRRKTIEDAGGWSGDTLTEDLDLSYRAQLKGWKIKYNPYIVSPAELPCEIHGLKSQQFRWMKGGAENARKFIPAIIRSELPFVKKLHAATHLLSSSVFVLVFLLAVLSVPLLFILTAFKLNASFYWIFLFGVITAACVYFVGNQDTAWAGQPLHRKLINFTIYFPLFLCLSMGLSLHNSIAVIQGYRKHKSVFVRTPKFNIQQIQDSFRKGIYEARRLSGITMIEGLLALYFCMALIIDFQIGKMSFVGYHLMLMVGFGSIFVYSVRHLSYN